MRENEFHTEFYNKNRTVFYINLKLKLDFFILALSPSCVCSFTSVIYIFCPIVWGVTLKIVALALVEMVQALALALALVLALALALALRVEALALALALRVEALALALALRVEALALALALRV